MGSATPLLTRVSYSSTIYRRTDGGEACKRSITATRRRLRGRSRIPTGTGLLYFTFLGGTANDLAEKIAIDGSGNVYVAGYTSSTGLATAGAAQTSPGGAVDGFIAKLSLTGSAFTYVTYLGSIRSDYLEGMAINGASEVYVTGYTDSANFPP